MSKENSTNLKPAKKQKPTPQHLQAVSDLMDINPDGVSLRQVQTTLSISPALAKAALSELGAVEYGSKWMFVVEPDPYQCKPEADPEPVTLAPEAVAELAPVEPVQSQLKKLTQDVFNGLPIEYKFARIYPSGQAFAGTADWRETLLVGEGYDRSNCENSLLERVMIVDAATLEPFADQSAAMAEMQKDFEEAVSNARTKSDFAVALEAERQRVLDAVAIGGTAARLAELTGLHVGDVQQHLDALIDDGAVVERPIIVAMSYKVAS